MTDDKIAEKEIKTVIITVLHMFKELEETNILSRNMEYIQKRDKVNCKQHQL